MRKRKRYILGDISGQRFTRLLALNISNRLPSKRYVDCLCDCGKKVTILKSSLISSNTKSCGCYRNEVSKNRLKGKSCISKAIELDQAWHITAKSIYKRSSYTDGDITLEKFIELSQLPCYYCNRPPFSRTNTIKNYVDYNQNTINAAWWIWNGLDRIDNKGKHTLDNV